MHMKHPGTLLIGFRENTYNGTITYNFKKKVSNHFCEEKLSQVQNPLKFMKMIHFIPTPSQALQFWD